MTELKSIQISDLYTMICTSVLCIAIKKEKDRQTGTMRDRHRRADRNGCWGGGGEGEGGVRR